MSPILRLGGSASLRSLLTAKSGIIFSVLFGAASPSFATPSHLEEPVWGVSTVHSFQYSLIDVHEQSET